jgi:hypothetical protein
MLASVLEEGLWHCGNVNRAQLSELGKTYHDKYPHHELRLQQKPWAAGFYLQTSWVIQNARKLGRDVQRRLRGDEA